MLLEGTEYQAVDLEIGGFLTQMPMMKEVIQSLIKAELRDRVRVMVGGAPVTEKFAQEIGADGYAPDAAGAVVKARELNGAGSELRGTSIC